MAKTHCMAYLERFCSACNKKILGRIYDYGMKEVDSVEDWYEEVELSVLPLPCDSCGDSLYPSFLAIYEQDQFNRPIRRIYAERIGRLYELEVQVKKFREELEKLKTSSTSELTCFEKKDKQLQKMVLSYSELATKMRARIVELETSQSKSVIMSSEEPPDDSLNDDDLYRLAKLENKRVTVFGWPKEELQLEGVAFLWHHGNCIDPKAVELIDSTDILICLNRYCDSNLLWWLHDVSISHQIPLILLDNKNIHHIIHEASKCVKLERASVR